MGGYSVPSFSTLGSHSHHWSLGMFVMTPGTWDPQPHHVFLPGPLSVMNLSIDQAYYR